MKTINLMRKVGNGLKIIANNLSVSYTDEGPDNASVIIFIHGFPLNKSMWDEQVEVFTKDYRVIVYDIRGFGNSDAGTEDFTIELFVCDLLELMDLLKIEKAVLCGLSMGGYIALNAIENFPKRFDALILCDTNCIADSSATIEKRLMSIKSIRKNGLDQYVEESLNVLFAPESFVTNKEKIAAVKEMIMKTSLETLFSTLLALTRRKETCTRLSDIHIPVLIVVGKEDQITPPEAAKLMKKKIQRATLNIIEHAGHLSNIENSYEFNDLIEKFVSSLKSK